jgi:hypothetical protein
MGAIGPNNPVREARLLSTAFTSQLAISVLLLGVAAVAPGSLTAAVFGDRTLAAGISPYDVLAVVFSVPLSVVASGYLEAIFFGGGRYDLYVKASMWATVLGFVSTLTMIWVWRLPGAFWSIFVASALLMTSFLVFVRRVRPLAHLFRIGFYPPEANALVRFSVAVLVSGALVPMARLLIQRDVIIRYGPDANGLLQVPLAITAYYTPFLTSPMWGRLHPRITHVGASVEGLDCRNYGDSPAEGRARPARLLARVPAGHLAPAGGTGR